MKFQINKRERVFDGFYKMDRLWIQHELYSGEMGPEIVRELMIRPDAVCVLLLDTHRDELVLVEQFRIAGAVNDQPWLLELVAGLIDKEESPEQVARREAEEEAGVTLGRMNKICEYLPSPGGATEKIHLFVAEVDSSSASGIHGLEEEGEDIKVQVIALDTIWTMLDEGRITNAASIIAIQWLRMNLEKLKLEWS